MAKKSKRCPVRYERDQSGCMRGLISMFDFRHGHSTQKQISDRRRGTRHAVGTGTLKNKLDNLNENCQGMADGEESRRATDDTSKLSVKKLIEEEMFTKQDKKKEINNPEGEPKQSNSENGDHRRRRSRTKSCDIHIDDLDVAESLESERPCFHNLEKQSTDSLDIGEIMEYLCCQIHQKSIGNVEHDQDEEVHHQPNQKNPDFEEKLSEAVKLINEKLTNWKHIAEDGSFHPSKELRDALQILTSDEELFPKLLQGSKSIMVKHVQSLWNARVEKDEDSKSLAGSNLSEQGLPNFRHSDEAIHGKQRKFFRRKTKSLDKNPSKENKASQASNRIVILKPGPKSLILPENESIIDSPPESQFTIVDKGLNERFGSHFSLTEIKRKLKNAMGKEKQDTSTDGTSKRFANKQQAVGNSEKGSKENLGRNSPSKNHFFIEKIARPPMVGKMREKSGKLKETEISMERDASIYPKQRASNIYIEAKKHLSEMLSTGQEDVDFSSEQFPKTLGRILSLPEYNFSPVGSPGRDWEEGFLTAQMRFSDNDKFQKHETNVSHLGRTALNSEPRSSVSSDSTSHKEQASSNQNASASNELHDKEEKTLCSVRDEMPSEGEAEVVKETEIAIEEESDVLDTLPEPSNYPLDGDDQNGDMSEVCDKKENSDCLKHDSEEGQPLSSPFASPSTSSSTKEINCLEGPEIPERPSPISVLEPLFTEEDVSPGSSRFEPVELPVQPLRIQFEEHEPSAADRIRLKAFIDDKESVFDYVKAVVQASGMKWDEFYMRSHSSEQLLDPSIFFEVEFFSNQLCRDKKLLFDSINEVLMEVYGRYFGFFSGLSFVQSNIRPVPDMKNGISEVWEGVSWHLLPLPMPRTLDQLVKKDIAKTGTWMDLRYNTQTILAEIGEAIFEDLMEETIFGDLVEENLFIHVNESSEGGNHLISAELKETECSMSP